MRSISSALAAAQRSRSRDPVVSAIVRNDWESVRRLDFTLLNDTFNTVGTHDVAVDGQGNVHRVRMDAGTVKYQKLTPAQQDTAANWDSWTDLVTGMGTKVAIAARGANVFVVYTNNVGTTSKYRESADHGATFSADASLQNHGSAVQDLAAAYKNDSGDLCVFAVLINDVIHAKRRVSGTFDAVVASGAVADSLNGIAASFAFDYELLITGVETTTLRSTVWSCEFLDASATFDTMRAQFQSEGTLSGFAAPSLCFLDTWRATFVELPSFSGGLARTYRTYLHPLESWNRAAFIMRAPLPTDVGIAAGLAIATGAGIFMETSYERVRRAPTALVTLDVSNDLQALELVETTLDAYGWIDLVNPDDPTAKRYALPHASPLQLGNMVRIAFGYHTDTPPGLRVMTGSYVGNGASSRAITGVGFRPQMVIIYSDGKPAIVKGDSAVWGAGSVEWDGGWIAANGIISTDDDGFTIGNNAHVNQGTGGPPTYHWIAIANGLAVGSYVGTGAARSITGVGFAPAVAMTFESSATRNGCIRTNTMDAGDSVEVFAAATFSTNEITSLDADGFSLGNGTDSNDTGHQYYYIAFPTDPSLTLGEYTGNGADNRTILAQASKYSLVMGDRTDADGINCVHRSDTLAGDLSHELINSGAIAANYIQSAATFQVGSDFSVNQDTIPFHYLLLQPQTAGSDETEAIQDFWITAAEIHHDEHAGRARLRLHLEGALRRLKRLRQYGSISHTTDDYRLILSGIMARAGLSLSVTNASTRSDTITPRFTIDPNTTAHAAMRAALAFIADRCHVDQGSSVNLQELVSGEASDYSLGNEYPDDPTEHPIDRLRLRSAPPPAGEVHVEALTAALAYLHGGATDHEAADLALAPLVRLRDFTSDAISEADETADVAIRQLRFERDDGAIWCPPIVNLQLLDVLELTDPYAYSIPNYKKRVSAITWRYRRESPNTIFEQVIDLASASDQDTTVGGVE